MAPLLGETPIADPQVPVVGTLTWPDVSVPQNAMPFSIGGHPYLLEIDEFASGDFGFPGNQPGNPVGAARIIDIADLLQTEAFGRRLLPLPGRGPR